MTFRYPLNKSILQRHNARNKAKKAAIGFPVKPKRFIIAIAAVFATLLLITATAAAFGYNFFDYLKQALNSPERKAIHLDNDEVFLADNFRVYDSMQDMIESENLKILYPSSLPAGYDLTNFEVNELDIGLRIRVYSANPFFEFWVEIGINYPVEPLYKTDIIEYSAFETNDGYFQAEFNYEGDYYTIGVDDESTLLEIINNLISED